MTALNAYIWIVLVLGLFHLKIAIAQDIELIGVVDNNLVRINNLTGEAVIHKELQNFTKGEIISDLTYNTANGLHYCIKSSGNAPSLISISKDGDVQNIGPLTLGGRQIPLVEALAYNATTNKLYAGVSLNGGTASNDFYSESIVEVEPSTGECQFLTEILTSNRDPDIDAMAFSENMLYISDGAPPGANFLEFYVLDINSVGASSSPRLLYKSTYLSVQDFTVDNNQIYFTENRNLRKYSIANNSVSFIGSTHLSSEFAGQLIRGISQFEPCITPRIELGSDISICKNQVLMLDPDPHKLSGVSYLWQDGSTAPDYLVNKPGTYWVRVENTCGFVSDTVRISYQAPPSVNLGQDRIVCNDVKVLLDATSPEATYTWQNGSKNPTLTIDQSGSYWVTVQNTCGVDSDTVQVSFQTTPTVDFGEDRTVCDDNDIILDATHSDAVYTWQDGSDSPTLKVIETGVYSVLVKNDCGSAKDTVAIVIPNFTNLMIPNVFTPNNDKINESFEIDSALLGSSISIFQRSGKAVYRSQNYQNDWNGGNLPSGIYFYLIKDVCGSSHKGTLSILY
ncbi:gliding motility-associated C-terminal domain-containing protein [Fulvivirga sp. M361]|uniref:T9SS type B sorting domain-containing protein n=1 Tax=Fulvivirga sp. M361 TaxID=2594266 RepID=UPI00117B3105|nr:gliding motility-associated C-terminal domain-containing protein [Fulvivirga sp. M361]TRX52040.1 gliding motility-associated C-terminal domain-containing protein [Fulvivirga sp. M361]